MCKAQEEVAQAIASELKTREATASAEKTKKELAQADSEANKAEFTKRLTQKGSADGSTK